MLLSSRTIWFCLCKFKSKCACISERYLHFVYTSYKHADNPQTLHQQHANSLHAYLDIANVHVDVTCAYLHNFICYIFFFISISFVYIPYARN